MVSPGEVISRKAACVTAIDSKVDTTTNRIDNFFHIVILLLNIPQMTDFWSHTKTVLLFQDFQHHQLRYLLMSAPICEKGVQSIYDVFAGSLAELLLELAPKIAGCSRPDDFATRARPCVVSHGTLLETFSSWASKEISFAPQT
jgi:hypothetical protein